MGCYNEERCDASQTLNLSAMLSDTGVVSYIRKCCVPQSFLLSLRVEAEIEATSRGVEASILN